MIEMATKLAAILGVAAVLTGCANAPQPSSQQSLTDASPDRAAVTLVNACAREAEWPMYRSGDYRFGGERRREQMRNLPSYEVRQMQSLCYRMDRAGDDDKAALAEACQTALQTQAVTYGARAEDHIRRAADICQRMTAPAGA